MKVWVDVRGQTGRFERTDGQGFKNPAEFPDFLSPEEAGRQIDKLLADGEITGLFEACELRDEVEDRWGKLPLTDRMEKAIDGFIANLFGGTMGAGLRLFDVASDRRSRARAIAALRQAAAVAAFEVFERVDNALAWALAEAAEPTASWEPEPPVHWSVGDGAPPDPLG